ncbi:MAG TPA: enolase C-terminal domain-like protein [Candidatus Sulfotelmatobacter sp.]|nr:enolase C-terminal domain-like protein [Candidatus Sulfotelmatobacter sp.]
MSQAPLLTVRAVEAYERPFKLRLPFRFGITTVTHGRQAVVRLCVRLADGREGWGYSAEALAAKWFDKNPALSDEQNLDQLRQALQLAAAAYRASGPQTAFGFFADHYAAHNAACGRLGLLPLVASFGPALLDRAILDALCRLHGVSFYAAMRANLPGMVPHAILPDLQDFDFDAFLAGLRPQARIHARHTVGLVDPITASDQAPGTRVGDGLPETLEEVVQVYGHRYYKLKVGGDLAADIDRLGRIAAVLDRIPDPYRATLDGNEQYETAEAALALWRAIEAAPNLARLRAATLFVEQPIKRQTALQASVAAFAAAKPLIIDESDGELGSFVAARALGYRGVSSKACKGFYKSLANLARCRRWNAGAAPESGYFMSGEDLTVQAGTSLQQDLALVSLLGLVHVERNGHHFIDGFAERPASESDAFLAAHPDLYHRQGERVRLRIERGELTLGSLDCPGLGTAVEPDIAALMPMPAARWP